MSSTADGRVEIATAAGGNGPVDQIEAAIRRGAYAEALTMAEALTRADPHHVEAWSLLGRALDGQDRTPDAIGALESGLAQNPSASRLHNQLASLFHKAKDPDRAELHLRRAVEIDPSFAAAWNNLAKSAARGGRLGEAEQAFEGAIAAEPNQPFYLVELARFVFALGRSADAERLLDRADQLSGIFLDPDNRSSASSEFLTLRLEVALRMADVYLRTGRPTESLGHLEQAIVLGAGTQVQTLFIQMLQSRRFSAPRPTLKPILQRAFEERWANPLQIGRLAAQVLICDPDVQTMMAWLDADGGRPEFLETAVARRVMNDPLLLALLSRTLVVEAPLERLLSRLRWAALQRVQSPAAVVDGIGSTYFSFFAALANQCFGNEYAYAASDTEASALATLVSHCRATLESGQAPRPWEIALIASYGPLNQLLPTHLLSGHAWPAWLETVFRRQILEPSEEAELGRTIPTLTAIRNIGSQAVQQQYEDNPFPRWVDDPARAERQPLSAWINRTFATKPELRAASASAPHEVLVTGCGTGQETAALSLAFSDATYFAIDLSRTSLAYAMRRSRELRLENVTYAQADLLELRGLDRQFDVVISAGVLHHLDDPLEGWRTLKDITRPGGVMMIALYSALGRRELAAARAFASEGGYGVSAQELRRFRSDVLALPNSEGTWHASLLARDDFYSLSMLRDLLCHERETCFTIAQISDALKALDLQFCGFAASSDIMERFANRFGVDNDVMSLSQWDTFESENPDTFWHMYHFLVQKA